MLRYGRGQELPPPAPSASPPSPGPTSYPHTRLPLICVGNVTRAAQAGWQGLIVHAHARRNAQKYCCVDWESIWVESASVSYAGRRGIIGILGPTVPHGTWGGNSPWLARLAKPRDRVSSHGRWGGGGRCRMYDATPTPSHALTRPYTRPVRHERGALLCRPQNGELKQRTTDDRSPLSGPEPRGRAA